MHHILKLFYSWAFKFFLLTSIYQKIGPNEDASTHNLAYLHYY